MATLTINYHTLIRALTDGPTEEDCQDNQAVVDSHLDRYLDYVCKVVEAFGHEFEVDYSQAWGPSLTVGGSDVSHEDEMELRRVVETIPDFWWWYN